MAITTWNDSVAKEMETVVGEEYGRYPRGGDRRLSLIAGINSFKFFLAYKGVFMVRDEEFYQGMKQCAKVRGYCSLSIQESLSIQYPLLRSELWLVCTLRTEQLSRRRQRS